MDGAAEQEFARQPVPGRNEAQRNTAQDLPSKVGVAGRGAVGTPGSMLVHLACIRHSHAGPRGPSRPSRPSRARPGPLPSPGHHMRMYRVGQPRAARNSEPTPPREGGERLEFVEYYVLPESAWRLSTARGFCPDRRSCRIEGRGSGRAAGSTPGFLEPLPETVPYGASPRSPREGLEGPVLAALVSTEGNEQTPARPSETRWSGA